MRPVCPSSSEAGAGWWVESEPGGEGGGLELRPGKGAGHKPGAPSGRQGEEGVHRPTEWRGGQSRGAGVPLTALGEGSLKEHPVPQARLLLGVSLQLLPAPQSRQARPYLVQVQLRDSQAFLDTPPLEASPEPPWAPGTTPRPALPPHPPSGISGPGPSLQG